MASGGGLPPVWSALMRDFSRMAQAAPATGVLDDRGASRRGARDQEIGEPKASRTRKAAPSGLDAARALQSVGGWRAET
jgi:hypothetical protein